MIGVGGFRRIGHRRITADYGGQGFNSLAPADGGESSAWMRRLCALTIKAPPPYWVYPFSPFTDLVVFCFSYLTLGYVDLSSFAEFIEDLFPPFHRLRRVFDVLPFNRRPR